ncbi:MAG: hypothetical protein PHH30_00885 [Bacteroidales bacterium]|nr:hypothetical protein [Bacteroidales bacterium]
MKRLFFISASIIIWTISHCQIDSLNLTKYDFSFYYNEGVYLDFTSFRNNTPISLESIIYPQSDDEYFFERIDTVKTIVFIDKYGMNVSLNADKIWGYSKNGKPYIYWADKFNLIPFIGSVCHFITTVTVKYTTYRDPFYDPYYYNPASRTYQTEELRQFLIDTQTGKVIEYNISNVEAILKREPELYNEFSKLSKRKKNKQLFYYVKLYNERRDYLIPD